MLDIFGDEYHFGTAEEKIRIKNISDAANSREPMSNKAMTLAERQLQEIKTGKKFGKTGEQKVRQFAMDHGIPWEESKEEFEDKAKAWAEKRGMPWVSKEQAADAEKKKTSVGLYQAAQKDEIEANIKDAMFKLVFKDGTSQQRRGALEDRLKELQDRKDKEPSEVEKSKLEAERIGLAGDLAMMDKKKYQPEPLDDLAQHGLYVGGSQSLNDPRIQIEQDILTAVREILNRANNNAGPMRDMR